MSLPAVASLIAFVRKHTFVLAAILLAILAGGCQRLASLPVPPDSRICLFENQGSLCTPPTPAELARYVDFGAVTKSLVKAVVQHYPALRQGPNQLRDLGDMVQIGLLKQARAKGRTRKEETDEAARLKTPLCFAAHLTPKLSLPLHNPQKPRPLLLPRCEILCWEIREFSPLLRMDKTPTAGVLTILSRR